MIKNFRTIKFVRAVQFTNTPECLEDIRELIGDNFSIRTTLGIAILDYEYGVVPLNDWLVGDGTNVFVRSSKDFRWLYTEIYTAA